MSSDLARSPAAVVAAPVVLLTFLFLGGSTGGPAYYGVSQLSQAAATIAVIAPCCAGLAAWEGARLRRGGVASMAPARSELQILVRALMPVAFVAILALAFAFVAMLLSGPSLRARDFLVVAVPVGVASGHSVLAYACGRRLPAVVVVPSAVLLSWLWIAYPVAVDPLWLRHMTGNLSSCCDIATSLALGPIVAPMLVSAGAILAAVALLGSARALVRRSGVAVALAVGFGAAALVVSGMGAEPGVARSPSALRCVSGTPRVCLWVEHRAMLGRVQRSAAAVHARLRRASIATPPLVTEARNPGPRAWSIGITPDSTAAEIDAGLIQALVPQFPPCSTDQPYPAYAVFGSVALWLAERGSANAPRLLAAASDEDRRELASVDRLPATGQRAWYDANVAALKRCGVAPRLLSRRL